MKKITYFNSFYIENNYKRRHEQIHKEITCRPGDASNIRQTQSYLMRTIITQYNKKYDCWVAFQKTLFPFLIINSVVLTGQKDV